MASSVERTKSKKNNITPKFSDKITGDIKFILYKSNTENPLIQSAFQKKNFETYNIDSSRLINIITSLKEYKPKKSMSRYFKNSFSSIKKSFKSLKKKKNSANITNTANTTNTTNNNKNNKILLDELTDLSEGKYTNDIEVQEILDKLASYLNNKKYFNQDIIGKNKLILHFINKETQLQKAANKNRNNMERRLRIEQTRAVSADMRRLNSMTKAQNRDSNYKKALKMVDELNTYFESAKTDKDFYAIIKNPDFQSYSSNYFILKSLLNGEDIKPIHRLYYDLLYNLDTEKAHKNPKLIDNIIDILLGIRLETLKGHSPTQKELEEKYKKYFGKSFTH